MEGVLLINLGTPKSPSTKDVRTYLNEFLMDGRVIDIPYLRRLLLVRGIIVPFRAPKSAKCYKEIWDERGSPLFYFTEDQSKMVRDEMGDKIQIEFAMRYGNPSIPEVLRKFKKNKIKNLKIIPLYPQYASASTGTAIQAVFEETMKWEYIPSIKIADPFYDHPLFIKAFAELGREAKPENFDHIIFSYHGLPERQLINADVGSHCGQTKDCCKSIGQHNHFCYGAQCYETTRLLVEQLGLKEGEYSVSFQSRLGKDPWKQPFTDHVLEDLAKKGKKNILVFCPSFVADCLETLFEIEVEYAEDFKTAGGESVKLVPSLNNHPTWMECIKDIIEKL